MKRFEVTWKRRLNHNMVWLKIYAPLVAKHAKPGQFIILRTDEFGERIPLTMAGHNEEDGTIDLIYAAVGRTTMLMDQLEVGDCFADIVGPLGKPTHMDGLKKSLRGRRRYRQCARVSAGLRYAQAWRGN